MIVVSDTSPIINLARLGYLELLPALYSKVILPQAVFEEITIRGAGQPGAKEILAATWVEIRHCSNLGLIKSLRSKLDAGESEAIALSVELNADWLLIDEQNGRAEAMKFSLRVIGLLGILVEAKRKNLLLKVTPLMDALIAKCNFRISKTLYEEVKRIAGE